MTVATDIGAVCDLLQSLGLPALVVEPNTRDTTASNSLFSEFISLSFTNDLRTSFVDSIWTRLTSRDQDRWNESVSSGKAILLYFSNDEWPRHPAAIWSAPIPGQIEQSVLCIILSNGVSVEISELIAKGRELERQRLKEALHANFAQELLGAAFGAKLLADKLEQGRQGELAQSASALTTLLNRMAEQLPNLTEVPPKKE